MIISRIQAFALFAFGIVAIPLYGDGHHTQFSNKFILPQECKQTKSFTLNRAGENAGETRLGYCADRIRSVGLTEQVDGEIEFCAAVKLPKEILRKYAGSNITNVEFGVATKHGRAISIWVSESLDAEPLTKKLLGENDYKGQSWNKVTLKTPVTITGDKDLYIGYNLYAKPDEDAELATDVFGHETKDVNFFKGGGKWIEFNGTGCNFALRAYADGDQLPAYDAGVRGLDAYDIMLQGSPTKMSFLLRNYGTNTINSINVNLNVDNETTRTTQISGLSIANNEEAEVPIDNFVFDTEGNHIMELIVNDVNNCQDSDPTDNVQKKKVYIVRENATPMPRKLLFEEFTSETDGNMGYLADSVFAIATKKRDDIIHIKHHVGTLDDKFTISESRDMLRFFEKGKDGSFIPAVMIDRTKIEGMGERGPAYFVSDEVSLNTLFNLCKSMPTYVSFIPEATFNTNTQKIDLHINGVTSVCEMPFQTDLRLNVYVIEDNIATNEQAGAPDEWTQNGVIRRMVTGSAGEKLEINNYSFEKDYQIDIDNEWNKKNMRFVIFVNNYSDDPLQNMVYNSCETSIESIDGITDMTMNDKLYLFANNGTIQALGGKIVGVYDTKGNAVNNTNLSKGIYIVNIFDGNKQFTRKIAISR